MSPELLRVVVGTEKDQRERTQRNPRNVILLGINSAAPWKMARQTNFPRPVSILHIPFLIQHFAYAVVLSCGLTTNPCLGSDWKVGFSCHPPAYSAQKSALGPALPSFKTQKHKMSNVEQ